MASIVEQMKGLTKTCEEFSALGEELQGEQKREILKQFYELKKAFRQILSEKEVIFRNFEFKKTKIPGKFIHYPNYEDYLEDFAHLFSMQYGFHEEKVLEILVSKNKLLRLRDELMSKCFILVEKK